MKFIVDRKPKQDIVHMTLRKGEGEEFVRGGVGPRELVFGIGDRPLTRRSWFLLLRRIIQSARRHKLRDIALDVKALNFSTLQLSPEELAEHLGVQMLMANFSFTEYKTKPKDGFDHVERVFLLGGDQAAFRRGLARGTIIGEETNRARHIANMPAGEMTPALLAAHATDSVRRLPIKATVMNEAMIRRLKLSGVLAVGKGSAAKPKFIILEYRGGKRHEAPTVLVGKGVTFDSGGINLKPSDAILGMNMDMSGAASVIHTITACARLKVKKNIIVLVPAVENMLSGESYRPGDIIRSHAGKTIEVQNTDAEGRIILADALSYAKKYRPKLVIDIATLTGAIMVALGERAAGLFTEDESLETKLRHIGEAVGDHVWPMPLWDEYLDDIKGVFGDLGNVGETRWGGAITAAVFLKQFTEGYPWVHLDIGSRMTTTKQEGLDRGSAGAGVRLLVRYLSS